MPRKAVRGERRLSSLNMKTTERLRNHLESEAARSGRTLTHEVEYRLERSFTEDGTYTTATNASILRDIAGVFEIIGFDRSCGANKISRTVLMTMLERIVSAHLPDAPSAKSPLSDVMPSAGAISPSPAPDTLSVSDENLSKIMAKCFKVVDGVLDSSALADLPPVVTAKGAPFGFHSNPFSPAGVKAKISGKPAGLLELLEKGKEKP